MLPVSVPGRNGIDHGRFPVGSRTEEIDMQSMYRGEHSKRVASLRGRRCAGALILSLLATAAWSQTPAYPSKPIRWIVGFAPGGITDIMTRILARQLSESLGQPVVVENRAGGGGLIAAQLAARAPADGYTLFSGTISTLATNVSTYRKLPYDPVRDFAPVTLTAMTPYLLVVHASIPAHSVKAFVALAKKRPGQITFGTAGAGGGSHLATEMFRAMAGIDLVHVPYKGAAPAMTDLLAGQIGMNFNQPPSTLPHMASGRIRVLAASGARRIESMPDVPTLAEAGLPGYEATSWQGLLVPAGTPAVIVNRLHKDVSTALSAAEMRDRLKTAGSDVVPTTPDEFSRFIVVEIEKWAKVVKEAGLTPQ
jgi:tripartite-type tricarboxylate transporter receptor subunit TctC